MTATGKRKCLCRLMQTSGGERDDYGHETKTPVEVAKLWCSIKQLSASKLQSYQQQYPTATVEAVTVFSRLIKPRPDMWLEYGERELHLLSVENIDEANREWRFICSEQVKVRDE